MNSAIRLPIRVAHPTQAGLDYINGEYFALLKKCGYEGFYLQDSPFDGYTGNGGNFDREFHLISLYDIAYSYNASLYREYINEVCKRAAEHDLKVYLCCWEPRLPFYAWSETPPEWRGHGGWGWGEQNAIAFCWAEAGAVAYWKKMAKDAMAALPLIAGVHIGMVDNEADCCNATCPKCGGKKRPQMMEDVYSTFAEIAQERKDFRLAIYDWWLPAELIEILPGIVGKDALVIGRSSKGLHQEGGDSEVDDMTMIFGECGSNIIAQKQRVDRLGLRLVDMLAWSHGNECWWVPAPPHPRYAIEKLNALVELGAHGWYDFDCGALEPGSIADAIAVWTAHPDRPVDELVEEVLSGIFGAEAKPAAEAYAVFREGVRAFPMAYTDREVGALSSRILGVTSTQFAPWHLEDIGFRDTRHQIQYFACFNFVTASTIQNILPHLEKTAKLTWEAFQLIAKVSGDSVAIRRERDAFEIHARQYLSAVNYFHLGRVKLDWLHGKYDQAAYVAKIREVAEVEWENFTATADWMARNPGAIGNPCHHPDGHFSETWPYCDFFTEFTGPKRRSLQYLRNFTGQPPRPDHLRDKN